MSSRSPIERAVATWLEADAPDRAPEHLREAARAAVDRTGQRSRATWSVWDRGAQAAFGPAFLGVAATVVIVVLISAVWREPQAAPAGPASRATASLAPSPPTSSAAGFSPTPSPTPQGRLLPAGRMVPDRFRPRLSLDMPSGWLLAEDLRTTLYLNPLDAGSLRLGDGVHVFDGIRMYRNPVAGPADGGAVAVEGVGTDAHDLAAWLAARPQLVTASPSKTSIGGATAWQLDIRLSPQAGSLCGMPCVNLFNSGDDVANYQYGPEGSWRSHVILVDAPDGTTLLVSLDDVDATGSYEELRRAQSIIDSLRFQP